MTKKQIINILNNQSGIFAKHVSEEEYNQQQINDIIDFEHGLKIIITNKQYYPEYKGCKWLVTYKILGEIII